MLEYNKSVSQMEYGDEIEGFYVLKDASIRTTTSGKPFLSLILSDITGTIDAKVWDYTGPLGAEDVGNVVKVRGEVSEYKGTPQFAVSRIRLANAEDRFSLSDLVPTAPIDTEKTLEEIKAVLDTLEDTDYRGIAQTMLSRHLDAFRLIPAAKSVHHSFLSGLLMHTAQMVRLADSLSARYPDIIDRNLLITGTLLHDFSKEKEFAFSNLGLVTDYSTAGQLLGHLVMGAQEVREVAKELSVPEEKSLLLQHLILSHHGEPDYGAAVRPICAEAELLSLIDMIDSKMQIYREALEDVPEGSFSGRIFALDKKIFHHH